MHIPPVLLSNSALEDVHLSSFTEGRYKGEGHRELLQHKIISKCRGWCWEGSRLMKSLQWNGGKC